MSAHNTQSPQLAFGGKRQLALVGLDKPLGLQLVDQAQEGAVGKLQRAGERLGRGEAAFLLAPEQMFEGIFNALAFSLFAISPPGCQRS